MELEVIRYPAGKPGSKRRPPLLFVHGSYCGAWVWEENFLPFFAANGYDCVAFSLRGHGRSEGYQDLDASGLRDFLNDLESVVSTLEEPPVLIGHSMGGMIVQKYLEERPVAGAVLMAAVSPKGGLLSSAMHMMTNSPMFLWQLSLMQMLGPQLVPAELVGQHLFSPGMSREKMRRYLPLLQRESSQIVVDFMGLDLKVHRRAQGVGAAVAELPPLFVIGGDRDIFVSVTDLRSTASAYQADLEVLQGVNHMMMLDTCWENVAVRVLQWLGSKGL